MLARRWETSNKKITPAVAGTALRIFEKDVHLRSRRVRQRDGDIESMRILLAERASANKARTASINQIHALLVSAPEATRQDYRRFDGDKLAVTLARTRPAPGTTPELIARASAKRVAQRHHALTADIAHIVMQRSDNEERQWILHAETVPELRHAPKRLLDPQSQLKRLTPPGPTNSPTTMSTIPQRIWRRNRATMPAITRITAMIQRIVAMVLLHFIQRRRAVRP
jgi:hypothetical protein